VYIEPPTLDVILHFKIAAAKCEHSILDLLYRNFLSQLKFEVRSISDFSNDVMYLSLIIG